MSIKWTKPNGAVIETNDNNATIEYCKSLGWIRDDDVKQEEQKRRGRPPKESNE